MALTIKSTQYDGVKGAWVERGIATIIPAATAVLSNATQAEFPFDNNFSCNIGDQIWVNLQNATKSGLIAQGARVTAQGVAKVTLYNITGSNITDSVAETIDYELVHYS